MSLIGKIGKSIGATSQAGAGVQPTKAPNWRPCVLTWYDPALGGTNSASGAKDPHSKTSSGEPYSASAMTCAAPPSYRFGTMIAFRYNGKTVVCRVNDRGGAIQGAHFDLARAPATALGIISAGMVHAQFAAGVSASSAGQAAMGMVGGVAGGQISTGAVNPLSAITDFLNFITDPTKIGKLLAEIWAWWLRLIAKAIWDWVIAPVVHRSQKATVYYWENALDGKQFGKGDYAYAIPWTLTFWSLGFAALFMKNEEGTMPNARNSILGRQARRGADALIKRRLHKPGDVKKHTPKRPEASLSFTRIQVTRHLNVTRRRSVKVGGAERGSKHDHEKGTHSEAGKHGKQSSPNGSAPSGGKTSDEQHRKAGASTQGSRRGHA